ncbi:hypothetical protein Q4Q34_00525 [Flavivirga abyssicola]|uniref:hypothetical protein n=1 Tax=Flavivirga abyssicola TaxID=3063533 RepID=UPI0026E02DCC|nr:hypothetical protein [Flavivirga sp. MEBiC07777]WVK13520.1 hypothetical protein Q4Q34_00525 [Flavivirga sp. MEBiC07777]
MKKIIIGILISTSFFCFGQNKKIENWTEKEKIKYQKLIELAQYVNGKEKSEISNDILFKKYIEFDYVLKDTSKIRIEKRIQSFDTLFYYFRRPIDSLEIKNLDAKPVRFYKEHKIYKPFNNELAGIKSNVFVYFIKDKPENPKGTLWFDEKSNKLIAWILLNQGGYRYFLSFNLL